MTRLQPCRSCTCWLWFRSSVCNVLLAHVAAWWHSYEEQHQHEQRYVARAAHKHMAAHIVRGSSVRGLGPPLPLHIAVAKLAQLTDVTTNDRAALEAEADPCLPGHGRGPLSLLAAPARLHEPHHGSHDIAIASISQGVSHSARGVGRSSKSERERARARLCVAKLMGFTATQLKNHLAAFDAMPALEVAKVAVLYTAGKQVSMELLAGVCHVHSNNDLVLFSCSVWRRTLSQTRQHRQSSTHSWPSLGGR